MMATATDPVCGMRVTPDHAAATEEHDGATYSFCSEHCRRTFLTDPSRYARSEGA